MTRYYSFGDIFFLFFRQFYQAQMTTARAYMNEYVNEIAEINACECSMW